jgi:hypothetical protein
MQYYCTQGPCRQPRNPWRCALHAQVKLQVQQRIPQSNWCLVQLLTNELHATNAVVSCAVPLQVLEHTGRTMQQFGMRTSPTRGMLEAQHYSTQQAAYQSGNLK